MDQALNNIEHNAVLYYADFLSLKHTSTPVTDTCKYFFIHKVPINASYIAGVSPVYDYNNPYYIAARDEYTLIRNKFGDDGVESYIENIANLGSAGMVDAERMLKCIHQYSDKKERRNAINKYKDYKENQIYTHNTTNENGDIEQRQCTKYVAHREKCIEEQGISKSFKLD